MEAIDYVKLFKLDQENYDFKREEFISELGKEFLDYCQTTTIGVDKKTGNIYYYRFSPGADSPRLSRPVRDGGSDIFQQVIYFERT